MTTLIALLYSSILFTILSLLAFFILKQIQKTQNLEKRLVSLQKKVQLNSVSFKDYYKLGHVYLNKKLYKKGIIAFRQSLRYWDYHDKISLTCLYNTIGVIYFKLAKYEYALYYFFQGINISPDYTLGLCNIAYTLKKLKLHEESEIAYSILFSYEK